MNRVVLGMLAGCVWCALATTSNAGVISYLSSERYIQLGGDPFLDPPFREDAVGLTDFNASHTNSLSTAGLPVQISASQSSMLRGDRINFLGTAFTPPGAPSTASGASVLQVVFRVDAPTPYTLYTGPIFHESLEGTAFVALNQGATPMSPYLVFLTSQSNPVSGLLLPGEYTLSARASAGRLQNITGHSFAAGALVVPAPGTALLVLSVTFAQGLVFRRRALK